MRNPFIIYATRHPIYIIKYRFRFGSEVKSLVFTLKLKYLSSKNFTVLLGVGADTVKLSLVRAEELQRFVTSSTSPFHSELKIGFL